MGSSAFHIIPETDHWTVARPDTADAEVVKIAQCFLSETQDRTPFAAEADYKQPRLQLFRDDNAAGEDAHKRFVFTNQAIPFVGRGDEIAHIEKFLAPDKSPFRWMVLSGSGGMGKSRLALEVCQANSPHLWNAGFLEVKNDTIAWDRWQPRLPTLIVIDDTGRKANKVGDMLDGLANRSNNDTIENLQFPVRVILIERDADGPWLNDIKSDRVNDGLTRHPNLQLKHLKDTWPIFEAVEVDGHSGAMLGRETSLEVFSKIDSQCRPLFAYLMADAIAREENVRAWDQTALLKNVLDRDRDKFWYGPPHGGAKGALVDVTRSEENMLALATITGGIGADVFDGTQGQLLPEWDIYRHPSLFKKITGAEIEGEIPPLEPDIVGEYFALKTIEKLKSDSDSDAEKLIRLAWDLRPDRTWSFVSRCEQDFPNEESLNRLDGYAGNTEISRKFWSMGRLNRINSRLVAGDAKTACKLYSKLEELALDHPTESQIRLAQARAIANLIQLIQVRQAIDIEYKHSLYHSLKAFAKTDLVQDLTTKSGIRHAHAVAAVNLMNHELRASNIKSARIFYCDIKSIVRADTNQTLRISVTPKPDRSFNIPSSILIDHAQARMKEKKIRLVQAKAVVILIQALQVGDLKEARELYRDLEKLGQGYRDELKIQKLWVIGLTILFRILQRAGLLDEAERVIDLVSNDHKAPDIRYAAEYIITVRSGRLGKAKQIFREMSPEDKKFIKSILSTYKIPSIS